MVGEFLKLMKLLKLSLLFLSLAMGAYAKDVYRVRNLSERELLHTYTTLLVEACRHADQFWKTASFDAAAGYWGDGASDGRGTKCRNFFRPRPTSIHVPPSFPLRA